MFRDLNLKKKEKTQNKEINFRVRQQDCCNTEQACIFLHHDFRPAGQKI